MKIEIDVEDFGPCTIERSPDAPNCIRIRFDDVSDCTPDAGKAYFDFTKKETALLVKALGLVGTEVFD